MNEQEVVGMAIAGAVGLFMMLIGIIVGIFFLLTLYRCLTRVKPENREMEPALVWLNLIPFVNLVWIFFTVIKLADSLVAEARSQSLDLGDGGKALGIAFAALSISGIIPIIGFLTGLAGFVTFIIYWIKIAGYANEIKAAA